MNKERYEQGFKLSIRAVAAIVLLLSGTGVNAQSFKIEERTDALSRETSLHAETLKLCQVKAAGFAAECATLQLAWTRRSPNMVAVRIELPSLTSVLEVAANVDGEVRRYGASVPVTDIDYQSGLRLATDLGFSSANVFVVPIDVLHSLVSNAESGLLRVSGTHGSVDFDFWRKAKMRGLPADELREFLAAVVRETPVSVDDSEG